MSQLVGVKYVGNKQRKEDNVANTGAVWAPGQVHNFTKDIADKLVHYVGVFELAAVDEYGDTYFGGGVTTSGQQEVIPFVNIHAMDANSLVAYARLNFNKVLDAKTPVKDLRLEISKLMSLSTLDELKEQRIAAQAGKKVLSISMPVTEAEYQAFVTGLVTLKLVPNDVVKHDENEYVDTEPTEGAIVDFKVGTEQAKAESAELPSLPELLAQLDIKGLRQLAKEQGVNISNTMNEEQLRTKLLKELQPKDGE